MFAFGKKKHTNVLTGIVTGPTGVATATVCRSGDGLPVLESCSFEAFPVGPDTDLGPTLKRLQLDSRHCASVLPVGAYQLLVVDAPEVPDPEMRAAIRWRIQDMIDFHIDDAVLDIFDAPASGPGETKKQIYVVVTHANRVKQHIDQLEQADVNLDIIDIPELAMRNIAACLPEDAGGLVTLYFTADDCLVCLTHNADLYLARTLNIGYRQLQENASNPQPLCNRLALEIQRSMDFYENTYRQAPITSMAILPTPVALYGLEDALEQTLGLDTRSVNLQDIVTCQTDPESEIAAHCILAVGAALRTERKAL